MRNHLVISFVLISFLACNKNIDLNNPQRTYIQNVKASLKDSLTAKDFNEIEIEKSMLTKIGNDRNFLKVPFKGKDISKDFLLLQTENSGKIARGFIINLRKNAPEKGKESEFNGFITKSSLDRKQTHTSTLTNGAITHIHSAMFAYRDMSFPIPKDTVVITTTGDIPTDDGGGITYSDWISVSGIFGYYGNYGSYGTDGSYGANGEFLYGAGGRYSGNSGYTAGGGTHTEAIPPDFTENYPQVINTDALLVDYEFVESLSPIDITKYLKCFSNIPNEGSTCSITILVDIPVDNQPNRLFNFEQGSPGHTFLQITKTNGYQSVTQNIGFYPNSTWKMLLTEPVLSKIVDNSEHEFNASLKMDITPQQLNNVLSYMDNVAKHDYDIDDYNCTDFALEAFNLSREENPIEIQKFAIPGGRNDNTSTPGALYNKIKNMQIFGVESGNINIPEEKSFVGKSSGACN